MTETGALIEQLASSAKPVRRLWSPCWRLGGWLVGVGIVVGALTLRFGPRPDLFERLGDASFTIGIVASALTSILAACAAFMASLPDRSRRWLWLPVPTALIWLFVVGGGCLTNWVSSDFGAWDRAQLTRCFIMLFVTIIPPSAVMLWLLRHSARLHPRPVILASGVAVAALIATVLGIMHRFETSALILFANFGVAGLVLAVDSLLGLRFLRPRL